VLVENQDPLLVNIIQRAVLVTSLICWAVIGLGFWIPRLLTASIILWLAALGTALTHTDIAQHRTRLESAVRFYGLGFKYIHAALAKAPEDMKTIDRPKISIEIVIFESLGTVMFWMIVYLIVKVI